jgi:hypothetical protein
MSKKPKLATVKVKLEIPLEINDETDGEKKIEEVILRRLKVKDLRKLPDGCLSKEDLDPLEAIPIIAVLTGLKEKWVEELDLVDLDGIVRAASPFLPRSQKTGKR